MAEEKQMTQEEYQKYADERKKELDNFMDDLKENSDKPVTKGELAKIMDFIFEDFGGLAQMATMNTHNVQSLGASFNQLMTMLQGGRPAPIGKKTKGGLIIP